MKLFKKIVYTMLIAFAITSCNESGSSGGDDADNTISVQIIPCGSEYELVGQSTQNLLAVQIYEVSNGGEQQPYANGVFSSWNDLQFDGKAYSSYKVEMTLLINAATRSGDIGDIIGAATTNELEYSDTAIDGIASSEISSNGVTYTTPAIDRYYGSRSITVTQSNSKIETELKRVSFGVKLSGIENITTLQIAGAPAIEVVQDETIYFSMNDIIGAYNADESSYPYSETMAVEVISSDLKIISEEVTFRRNQLATVTIAKGDISVGFDFENSFEEPEIEIPEDATAYITKVLEYIPAPGQFTNKLPLYEDGDTQEDMNRKVLKAIGNNNLSLITLGGFGGSVTVGFDHTIVNKSGLRDFRVTGNAFYSAANPDKGTPAGGSCEPAIIMVAYDKNKNGAPDDDEWYEIAGSSHKDATKEDWYKLASEAGNDVNMYFNNFEITYARPEVEPEVSDYKTYISWSDNKGNTGYIPKNMFHKQCYYPQWITSENLTFKGSRLPQNSVDVSGKGSNFVLYKCHYGYADNEKNNLDDSAIDIAWAVDADGNSVDLPGVDFIKIYTGVNQLNGWLGESSSEVSGVEDLHVLKVEIPTR